MIERTTQERIIAVGSLKSIVKHKGVELAFNAVWPDFDWEIVPVNAKSNVPDQPLTEEDTIQGAINRAREALNLEASAEYGVGIEGGMRSLNGQWIQCDWVAVINRDGVEGLGSAVQMQVPSKLMEHILNGVELGDAIDIEFNEKGLKNRQGFNGLLTNNALPKTEAYRDGTIAALARFVQPHLFKKND